VAGWPVWSVQWPDGPRIKAGICWWGTVPEVLARAAERPDEAEIVEAICLQVRAQCRRLGWPLGEGLE
jgi:hypothetical protein